MKIPVLLALFFFGISWIPDEHVRFKGRFYIIYSGAMCETCLIPVMQQIRLIDTNASISIVTRGFTGREQIYLDRSKDYFNNAIKGLTYINNKDTFDFLTQGDFGHNIIYCINDTCAKVSCFANIIPLLKWAQDNSKSGVIKAE